MVGYDVKNFFFDRQKIIDATTKAQRANLSKAGAFIRTRAKSSMRKRKASAQPNQPPSAHGNPQLKNLLYFAYDPSSKSVVIGPTRFRRGTVPELMEKGGTGPVTRRGVTTVHQFAPHPYMGPALAAEQKAGTISNPWKDSIKA